MRIALNVLQQGPLSEGPEWWKLLDESGVHVIGLPDSPALVRELYVTSAACAVATSNATIMTSVTNPVSRDPSVTAAALLTLHELAPGRIAMGIGTGDSAMWGVGMRPATVAQLRNYILAVRALLNGESAQFQGRTFRMQWSNPITPVDIPIVVAASGPRVLKMASEVADGMLLSMGFGPHNVAYVQDLVNQGCAAVNRDPAELDLWWNSEIVFGESVQEAINSGMGVGTEWLTMGTLKGKQIPEELKAPLLEFNANSQDLASDYQDEDRERALIRRATELGLYDWLIARAPGLWGRPVDVARRLRQLESEGMNDWMFYVGRSESDRMNQLRLICNEVLPLLNLA